MASTLTHDILRTESIARADAAGVPDDAICAYHDITPAALTALRKRADYQSQLDEHRERGRLGTIMAEAYARQLLPQAWRNIAETLEGPPTKERADASWRIINKFVPDATKAATDPHNLNINVVSNETITALTKALTGLASTVASQEVPVVDLSKDRHLHRA